MRIRIRRSESHNLACTTNKNNAQLFFFCLHASELSWVIFRISHLILANDCLRAVRRGKTITFCVPEMSANLEVIADKVSNDAYEYGACVLGI